MPLQATSGAASYDAFGGGVPVVPNYIEDVFSTYLYTGNGSSQTITNGIDLSGKGGLVWFKRRSTAISHALFDSARSSTSNALFTNTTGAQVSSYGVTFNSNGVSLGQSEPEHNSNGETYVSWTFRKQPKFFDVQTWTGDGTSSRAISHALGSTPGCIIIKKTNGAQSWFVYHRSLASTDGLVFTTQAADSGFSVVSATSSTTFTIYTTNQAVNTNGDTYVAYLFAHNAGGFGLTGTDNVISCGSFSASMGSLVNIGFEPQFVLIKKTTNVDDWLLFDNMRGLTMGDDSLLNPNTSGAENNSPGNDYINPQPTGFTQIGFGSGTFIYIAIRRGPMKVPTSGTSVFSPQIATSSGSASNTVTTNFPVDLAITQVRNGYFAELLDRLRGDSQSTYVRLRSASTAAEATGAFGLGFDNNTGYVDNYNWQNFGGGPFVYWNFKRAPSFFDEVCYTGNQTARTISHNLAAAPELMITKNRSSAGFTAWLTCVPSIGMNNILSLNTSGATDDGWSSPFTSTPPTSSVFSLSSGQQRNETGVTYVAYLFATCAGVSKVGSYTGTATTKQIDCGFTAGARFVLIKKTSGTGSWYVWDSARGIVSGNDPYLLLNSTAAEVTNTDYIDTYSAGFEISSTAPSEINENGGSFIFLAIA